MKTMSARNYKARRVLSVIVFSLGIAILLTFAVFALFGEKIAPYSSRESFDKFLPCSREPYLRHEPISATTSFHNSLLPRVQLLSWAFRVRLHALS